MLRTYSMSAILGMEMPNFQDETFVLTTETGICGAAPHLLDHSHLIDLCKVLGTDKLWVFPSSTNELLCRVYTSEEDREYFDSMVKDINRAEVAREEWLGDAAWTYTASTDTLEIRGTLNEEVQ